MQQPKIENLMSDILEHVDVIQKKVNINELKTNAHIVVTDARLDNHLTELKTQNELIREQNKSIEAQAIEINTNNKLKEKLFQILWVLIFLLSISFSASIIIMVILISKL